jgi:hypothetical protein
MKKEFSIPADVIKFFAHYNLDMHIKYYNEHKRLVSNQVVEINREIKAGNLDAKRKQDLEIAKDVYLNSYHQHMIINTFLMMYSHLEEFLGVTCKLLSKKMPENKRSGLDRFKEHFEAKHSLKLSDSPHWSFLRDCAKVRDLILHAAGNVTLARGGRQQYDKIVKQNKNHFTIANSRLVPKEVLLTKFSKAVREFTEWLTDQVK